MRIQRLRIALPLAFTSLLLIAWNHASTQEVKMVAQEVSGPVHMVEGRGGNLGVSIGEDGLLLIDDQFANLAPQIQEALDKIAADAGFESGVPRFLINTHFHGDHTGGNAIFGKQATILAHENVRARLMQPGQRGAMPKAGLPVVTYAEGISLHFNDEEIRLIHMPHGHTDGDTVVHFTGSNVVHMGDLMFNGRFPYIDMDSGGSVTGYLANIETVLGLTDEDTQFIPGHGALGERADLEGLFEALDFAVSTISEAKESGRTLEEIKASDLLSEYAEWGTGFISTERMIDMVWRELNQ